MKRIGRPKDPNAIHRNGLVYRVWLRHSQYDRLKQIADTMGLSKAEVVRRLIDQAQLKTTENPLSSKIG